MYNLLAMVADGDSGDHLEQQSKVLDQVIPSLQWYHGCGCRKVAEDEFSAMSVADLARDQGEC